MPIRSHCARCGCGTMPGRGHARRNPGPCSVHPKTCAGYVVDQAKKKERATRTARRYWGV